MKIAVGADHAGYRLKDFLADTLRTWGYEVADVGTHTSDAVDYPDYAALVAQAVADGRAARGVLVCGSGIGMQMRANRVAGVRAAVLRDGFDAQMSREHNDANIACFGARATEPAQAQDLLHRWLDTAFAGGRHAGRVAKLDA